MIWRSTVSVPAEGVWIEVAGFQIIIEEAAAYDALTVNLIRFPGDPDVGGFPCISRTHYTNRRGFQRFFVTGGVADISLLVVTECDECLHLPQPILDAGDFSLILTADTFPAPASSYVTYNTLYLFQGDTKLETVCTFPEVIDKANIDRGRKWLIATASASGNLYFVDYGTFNQGTVSPVYTWIGGGSIQGCCILEGTTAAQAGKGFFSVNGGTGASDNVYRIDLTSFLTTKISNNKYAGGTYIIAKESTGNILCDATFVNACLVGYSGAGSNYFSLNTAQIFNNSEGLAFDGDSIFWVGDNGNVRRGTIGGGSPLTTICNGFGINLNYSPVTTELYATPTTGGVYKAAAIPVAVSPLESVIGNWRGRFATVIEDPR